MSAVFWPSCLPCSVLVVPDCPVPLSLPERARTGKGQASSMFWPSCRWPVPGGTGAAGDRMNPIEIISEQEKMHASTCLIGCILHATAWSHRGVASYLSRMPP